MREHRQPSAGAGVGTDAGNCRAGRARRVARADRPPTAHRECSARDRWRQSRRADCLLVAAGAPCRNAAGLSRCGRRARRRHGTHGNHGRGGRDRPALRPRAGDQLLTSEPRRRVPRIRWPDGDRRIGAAEKGAGRRRDFHLHAALDRRRAARYRRSSGCIPSIPASIVREC